MPTYEYACKVCGHNVTVRSPNYAEEAPDKCAVCDGPMRKLYGPVSFTIK